MIFLVTQPGAGFTAGGFGNWFHDASRDAGIADRSAHGLRKSAATRLADAGYSESQIKAVTGHQTSKEVEHYTKARDQKRLAQDASAMIGGTQRQRPLASPATKLANPASKYLIIMTNSMVVADREGFEPSVGFHLHTLSKRARSTTPPPVRFHDRPESLRSAGWSLRREARLIEQRVPVGKRQMVVTRPESAI